MKKNHLVSVLMMSTLLCVSVSCSKNKSEEGTTKEITKRAVRVEKASEESVEQSTSFTATVQPMKKNFIATSQPNRIVKIYVEIGDRVVKGQKLVDMDPANYQQTKAQLENYEKDYKRLVELLNIGGASKQQVDQMKTQLEVTRASYALLKENVTLVSPINGVVTARAYDEGDMASQPILTVMQTQPVKVLINVSEQHYTLIKRGMKSRLTVDALPGEEFVGTVGLIYPTIDEATRTFGTEIYVQNNNNRIRPGMFGRIEMDFGNQNHIVVKDRAVLKQSGSNERYVFVLEEGKAKFRKVILGKRLGDKYEILSGLTVGDEVVVEGNTRLQDGMEVSVQ